MYSLLLLTKRTNNNFVFCGPQCHFSFVVFHLYYSNKFFLFHLFVKRNIIYIYIYINVFCVSETVLSTLIYKFAQVFVSLSLLRRLLSSLQRLRNWGCEKLNYSPKSWPVYGEVDLKRSDTSLSFYFFYYARLSALCQPPFLHFAGRILSWVLLACTFLSNYLNGST